MDNIGKLIFSHMNFCSSSCIRHSFFINFDKNSFDLRIFSAMI